jgi:hypothetical protein
MSSAYHVHPDFGYLCPTPYRRRELRVAIVSILFGAIIGSSIATLRAGHLRNPDGASTAAHADVSNPETVIVATAEATPAARNDADTKAEAREPIKPFPIRRVRVRPPAHIPPIPAAEATAPTPAPVAASASPLVEPLESAQGSGPPAASSHATKSAAAPRPSTAVKKRQRIAHVQSRRRNDERAHNSWHDNRGNHWTGLTYVDAYYLRAR